MQLLDVLLGLFIAGFAVMGLRAGLIHGSATLLGLVLGLVVAGHHYERFGPLFTPWMHTRGMSNLVAFLILLAIIWVLVVFLGALLKALLQGIHLGWLDNLGGLALGLIKGLFIAEVVVLVLMAVPDNNLRGLIMRSWIGSRLAVLGPTLLALVPPVLRYWKPL